MISPGFLLIGYIASMKKQDTVTELNGRDNLLIKEWVFLMNVKFVKQVYFIVI